MQGSLIGVDLGGTKILAGRVRPDGSVAARREVPTDTSSGNAILAQITAVVAELATDGDVVGVGVGIPGTIDQRRGVLVQAVNLPLQNTTVRDRLQRTIGVPVSIDNDANCAALAEHVRGAARGYSDSIMLTLGTGVGGGVVIGNRLFRGATGAGTELGHILIDRDGPPCQGSCPGRGHLESFCSGTALARAAELHIAELAGGTIAAAVAAGAEVGARLVIRLAAAGDVEAAALLAELGAALGLGLVSLANAFETEVFVVGGGFGEAAGTMILDPARRVLREGALHPQSSTPVVAARLGADAGMLGAAELCRL